MLAGQSVERVVVFNYRGPGEPKFWTAYPFVDGKSHTIGTSDLLALPLDGQAPDLIRQRETFEAAPSTVAGPFGAPNGDE